MSIQWRRALLIVPAGLALAPPAVAQEAGQTSDAASQQSTPPAPAGTIRSARRHCMLIVENSLLQR